MTDYVLTLNAGSSSLKISLYPVDGDQPVIAGQVERIGTNPALRAELPGGVRASHDLPDGQDGHAGAVAAFLSLIEAQLPDARIAAVAHRIVHGGPERARSEVLTAEAIEDLARLCPFAPLHQEHNLAGVAAAASAFPDAVQVGCFDTAFHRDHPWVNDTFALPRELYDKGVRRYGFHGLSYDYITQWFARSEPGLAAGRVVVAHLGNGASMCALQAGRSIASTMGFSALDGLAMGTRCGQIDPGVLLYLMADAGMGPDEITDLLYRKSGLLGLSGISHDMRTLEGSAAPEAAEAITYFVSRIRRELGALAASLSGLDALAFTGGIGENSASVRRGVCEGMNWLGITLDPEANERGDLVISAPASSVRVLVVPTDEESVLFREARAHLRRDV